MDNMFDDIFDNNLPFEKVDDLNVQSNEENIIPINNIIQNTNNNDVQNNNEVVPTKRKKDKVLIIQIVLLIAWAILTALVYFFGYDLFKPFINVG